VLRVAEVSGRREPAVSYRLDGLMARVMDQDLLPVLLTLRALMPPDEGRDLYYAWPGLEFEREDEIVEVDLLTSDGETSSRRRSRAEPPASTGSSSTGSSRFARQWAQSPASPPRRTRLTHSSRR
jgi:hypothetical protein